MIAEVAEDDKIIVEKSTASCRTAEDVRNTFAAVGKSGVLFDILSNLEFLAEGTAINEPDRILIGSLNSKRGLRVASLLADIYVRWVPRDCIITMNLWSAEMTKLAANALLAQRISSIKSLSAVCEVTGADIAEVRYACVSDDRIGSRMLKSLVCFWKLLLQEGSTLQNPSICRKSRLTGDLSLTSTNTGKKDGFIKHIIAC